MKPESSGRRRKLPVQAWMLAAAFPFLSSPVFAVSARLEEALKPLKEGIPEVAVVKLTEALASPALTPEERALAKKKRAEALLAAGRAEEALAQAEDPEVAAGAPMLLGEIHASLGSWDKALAFYDAAFAAAGTPEAALGRADCLEKLGRLSEAAAALKEIKDRSAASQLRLAELYLAQGELKRCEKLLPAIQPSVISEKRWKEYVEARLLLAQGHPAYALGRFERLQREARLSANLRVGTLFGMSDSQVELNNLTAADDLLEEFIWKHPESPQLGAVFQKLDGIYAGEEDSSNAELEKWAGREPAPRAGWASYYLAKSFLREKRPDRALKALRGFASRFPEHPLLAEALLMQGQLLVRKGEFARAQEALDAAARASRGDLQRAEIEMASARAHFEAGEFVLAATVFRAAGERAPSLWQRAVFNSALSWLHQGNKVRFLEDYKELSQRFPESPFRHELVLEEGLLQARQGNEEAEATLRQFLRDFPDNPRVSEARLALAELRFAGNDAAGASEYLKVANETPAPSGSEATAETPQDAETARQSQYLAIFVADAARPRDDDAVIGLCRAFLERHPESARRAEVRMKLGQVYFRNEDFASAQTQFETIAREDPGSPLAETALFLAGQASMKSMSAGGINRALELFEEVARMGGPLKFYARLQQALAQNQLDRQKEAILIYDAILGAEPPPEERFAALAGKAENLSELGEKEPPLLEQALALYTQLAGETELSVRWRNQALYKKARLLEKLERQPEALAAYYDVLESGAAKPEEYFWYYKAGFAAGRLFEATGQWKSAIGVYQKIAALDGPRSEEAKAQVGRLRLEHFIWE